MSEKTWEDHWASGDTPWDAGKAAPSLERLLESWGLAASANAGKRALVPGCGAGYDVFALACSGFQSVGLDIAPSSRPRFEALRSHLALDGTRAQLVTDDFFSVTAERLGGTFDRVWDYTFYCAIEPEQREQWKEQVHRLLKPHGQVGMLLFPVVPGSDRSQGPPYPLDPDEVVRSLTPHFRCMHLAAAQESHPGREGKEWLAVFERVDA